MLTCWSPAPFITILCLWIIPFSTARLKAFFYICCKRFTATTWKSLCNHKGFLYDTDLELWPTTWNCAWDFWKQRLWKVWVTGSEWRHICYSRTSSFVSSISVQFPVQFRQIWIKIQRVDLAYSFCPPLSPPLSTVTNALNKACHWKCSQLSNPLSLGSSLFSNPLIQGYELCLKWRTSGLGNPKSWLNMPWYVRADKGRRTHLGCLKACIWWTQQQIYLCLNHPYCQSQIAPYTRLIVRREGEWL